MLDFPEAVAATTGSLFGEVNVFYGMSDLECEGNEEDIRDCPHRSGIFIPWKCRSHGHTAGVVCSGNTKL